MRRGLSVGARLVVGAAILVALVQQLGLDAFLDPVRGIDGGSLVLAAGIAVLTTACCAWRWCLVSRGLGTDLSLRAAFPAYYQSQFLNTVLPGGVLGDVYRAVHRGRQVGDVRHGTAGVVLERGCGQVVQVALTVGVLLAVPSPVRDHVPAVVGLGLVVALTVVLVGRAALPRRRSRRGRLPDLAADLRRAVLSRRAWVGIVLTSAAVVVGHTATFVVAARAAGSTVPVGELLPLALLVLLAMAVPAHVAGWGPREGVAAGAFAVAGLGAAQGLAVAVVYGALAFVATLPGAAVLMSTMLASGRGGSAAVTRPRSAPVRRGGGHG